MMYIGLFGGRVIWTFIPLIPEPEPSTVFFPVVF